MGLKGWRESGWNGGRGRCGRDEEVTGMVGPSNAEGSHFRSTTRSLSVSLGTLCPSSRPPSTLFIFFCCSTSTLNHWLSYVWASSPRESSQCVSSTSPSALELHRRSTRKLPTLRFSWRLNAKLAANNVDNAGGQLQGCMRQAGRKYARRKMVQRYV